MTVVAIDVETIPDETKVGLFNRFVDQPEDFKYLEGDELAETYVMWQEAQMSLTPEYARIVGLNYMVEYLEPVSRWVGERVPSRLQPDMTVEVTERSLLKMFWQLARDNSTIVTFNGLAFDLEVIKVRSAILGVEANGELTNLKPWESRVIDLMKRMYGNRRALKLKVIREIYWENLTSLEPSLEDYSDLLEMEGSEVTRLYRLGDLTTLKRYGEFDILTNMTLYKFGKGYWW